MYSEKGPKKGVVISSCCNPVKTPTYHCREVQLERTNEMPSCPFSTFIMWCVICHWLRHRVVKWSLKRCAEVLSLRSVMWPWGEDVTFLNLATFPELPTLPLCWMCLSFLCFFTLVTRLFTRLYSLPVASYRERMKLPFMTDQCEQMLKICNEFVRLQVSYDEYLCMKVLLLLSTGNWTRFFWKITVTVFNFGKSNYSEIELVSLSLYQLRYTTSASLLWCEEGSLCLSRDMYFQSMLMTLDG